MLRKKLRAPSPVEGLGMVLFALGLSACARTQSQRHDRLYSAWRGSARQSLFSAGTASEARSPRNGEHLVRATFVHAVLDRNPNLESSRQAWRAALAEHAQESALDDPMFEYSFAPLSIASSDASYGQVITLSQKLPWPGKRSLAGEVALAEAEATQQNFETVRLHLALTASLLFDQYYVVERSLELNEQHHALVRDIKAAAQTQYETGRASQQEPLQAEVELAHVEHQRIVLSSRRAIIVAQMNGLLHQVPDTKLPPPPAALDIPEFSPGTSAELRKEALSNRPEFKSQHARIRSREAARPGPDSRRGA